MNVRTYATLVLAPCVAAAGILTALVFGAAYQVPSVALDTSVSAPEMPHCEYEDGSGDALPCRWVGGEDGNGYGLSFVVSLDSAGNRCYTYDDPASQAAYGACERP